MGSTGGICKSAYNHLLGGAAISVFKAGVVGTTGSVGVSQRFTGSCLGASVRSACSVGRFGRRGK